MKLFITPSHALKIALVEQGFTIKGDSSDIFLLYIGTVSLSTLSQLNVFIEKHGLISEFCAVKYDWNQFVSPFLRISKK